MFQLWLIFWSAAGRVISVSILFFRPNHWLLSREVHNSFVHEYPDDPELQAAMLNKVFTLANVTEYS